MANAVTLDATSNRQTASPYALLHLCDGAPRDLVEETYWLLVGKLRFGVTSAARELRLLDELNDAYGSITRNGHAIEPARERNVTPSRKRWRGGGSKPAAWKLDPFETLFVLPDADPDVIALAHKILSSRPPAGMNVDEWVAILDDAVNKVSDPSWRAKHERASAEDAWAATRRALEADAERQRSGESQEQARVRRAAEAERNAQRKAEANARRAAEAEAKARRQAEERSRREAEAEAKRAAEAEAKARRQAEADARREAEAEMKARRATEAEARRVAEAEAKAQREAEEQARRIAEDEQRREAEAAAIARREADERARRIAEDEQRRAAEAAAIARREAEDQARRIAEDEQRREAEAAAIARREAEEQARRIVEDEQRRAAEAAAIARREAEEQARRIIADEQRRQAEADAIARREADERARREAEVAARAEAERAAAIEAEARRAAAVDAERAGADARRAAEEARAATEAEARRIAAIDAERAAAEAARVTAEAHRSEGESRARPLISGDDDVTDDGQPEIVRKWVEMGVAQVDPGSGNKTGRREHAPREGSGDRVAGGLWGMLEHVLARGERQRESVERANERVLRLRDETASDAARHDGESQEKAPSHSESTSDERSNERDASSRPPAFLLMGDAPPATIDLAGEDTRQFTLGNGPNAARVRLWRRGDRYMLQQISGAPISIGGERLTAPVVVLEDGDEIAHDGDVMRIVLGGRSDGGV